MKDEKIKDIQSKLDINSQSHLQQLDFYKEKYITSEKTKEEQVRIMQKEFQDYKLDQYNLFSNKDKLHKSEIEEIKLK